MKTLTVERIADIQEQPNCSPEEIQALCALALKFKVMSEHVKCLHTLITSDGKYTDVVFQVNTLKEILDEA